MMRVLSVFCCLRTEGGRCCTEACHLRVCLRIWPAVNDSGCRMPYAVTLYRYPAPLVCAVATPLLNAIVHSRHSALRLYR